MEPQHQQIDLPDGYRAHCRWWQPASIRGGILYLHGIQSHGGWFEKSASALASAGWAVVMPDRRGSGANQSDRGHAINADQLIADVWSVAAAAMDAWKLDALHWLGVSWGGKLAPVAAAVNPEAVKSLTLVAPGLKAKVDVPVWTKLLIALSASLTPKKSFSIPLNDSALFTDETSGRVFIDGDPLRLHKATASFLMASHKLDRRMSTAIASLRFPIQLFLAGNDRIIDNLRTTRLLAGGKFGQIRIIRYPSATHTLEFESESTGFLNDLKIFPEA